MTYWLQLARKSADGRNRVVAEALVHSTGEVEWRRFDDDAREALEHIAAAIRVKPVADGKGAPAP